MPPYPESSCRAAAFLAFFLLLSVPFYARAKEKEEPITRPPSPQPVVASAFVGERTAIDLPLRGRIEEPVTIIIRKKPQLASITEAVRVNRKTWRVWYSAPPDSAENLDSFSYAAKSVDSPVSAAAQVQVSIKKRPAELGFPDSLDFGSVPVGDTSVQEIDIQNSGGKTAFINPVLRAPWKLVDATPIQIKSGEHKKISVAFSPDSSGVFADKLFLEPTTKRGVTLNASSGNPLEWTSTPILFSSKQRASTQFVSFKNLTDRTRHVVFEWPDFLEAASHASIEPDSILEIPLKLKAAPCVSWEGPVSFACGNFKGSIHVAIESAPAAIRLEPASVLDLGELPLGSSAKGNLTLTNSGGRPARVSIDVPNGIKVNPSPAAMRIEPGETTAFEVTATPPKGGTFDFMLPIHSDSETFGAFRVRATARSAQPVEKLISFPVDKPDSPAPPTPLANIPPVEECTLVESKPHSIIISWKVPDGADGFILESRRIVPMENGSFCEEWIEWKRNISFLVKDGIATATLKKLPSNTFWMIRVSGIDSKGIKGPPSRIYRIETTQETSFKIPFFIWAPFGIILVLGLGCFAALKAWFRVRVSQ